MIENRTTMASALCRLVDRYKEQKAFVGEKLTRNRSEKSSLGACFGCI
jgi:hypothetical protein